MKNKLQIKRILVPTDFSETGMRAVEHAAFMASLMKAELILLHVVETPDFTYSVYEPTIQVPNEDDLDRIAYKALEEISEKTHELYGIRPKLLVDHGRVSSGIAEIARDEDADIIIMGTHGAKGLEELFIGSNAHKTVTVAPCPVITLKTKINHSGFRNIVLPIDNSLHSRQKVDYAMLLAAAYASKIHIVGLMEEDDDKLNEDKLNIKLDSVQLLIEKKKLPFERVMVRGANLAKEAMEYAEKVKADLIVIMTDHESELNGIFLGTLAGQIVNHCSVPVMSVRPLVYDYESVDLGSPGNPFSEV